MSSLSASRASIPAILVTLLAANASAESQFAPFFSGLRTAKTTDTRGAYLKAESRSPDALILSEELPTLRKALADDDSFVNYLAGWYLSYLVQRQGQNSALREDLRAAVPAMAAHFSDPDV